MSKLLGLVALLLVAAVTGCFEEAPGAASDATRAPPAAEPGPSAPLVEPAADTASTSPAPRLSSAEAEGFHTRSIGHAYTTYQRFPDSCANFWIQIPENATSLRVALEVTHRGTGAVGMKLYDGIREGGHESATAEEGTLELTIPEPTNRELSLIVFAHGVVLDKRFTVRAETLAANETPVTIEAC